MRFPLFFVAAAAILSGSFCTPVAAAEPPISDPAFKLQGEYSGDRYSMQVIALGDGEFEIVVFDSPLEKRSSRDNPPRRIDADEDVVADLIDSLAVKRVVRNSPTLDAVPPTDAVVLFDGTQRSLGNWIDGRISSDGFLKQGTETRKTFRDYTLHLEFRTPWMPESSGQARGNSGVYQQGRYEVQVLDSFGLSGAKNEAGAIYEIHAPAINACLPPMQWQTYDIDFTAARYKGDSKV